MKFEENCVVCDKLIIFETEEEALRAYYGGNTGEVYCSEHKPQEEGVEF
jgi:hypothetical protein